MEAQGIATREEFSAAVAQYGQPMLRYCHHILCNYEEAQDAVQTAFLKAWEGRERFRAGTSLSAWLYRLAYTTCVDLLRARRLCPLPPPASGGRDYIGPELRRALQTLTARERALVFGRVMEERPYSELEEIYRIPAATLRKRYERARAKLARALTEQEGTYETQ